jgi:hypothetical protein
LAQVSSQIPRERPYETIPAPAVKGKEAPLPAAVDALIRLETADQLMTAGRHDEAIVFAANAVEECV